MYQKLRYYRVGRHMDKQKDRYTERWIHRKTERQINAYWIDMESDIYRKIVK